MARLKWTGGTFVDSPRGFRASPGSVHEFDDDDRVDEYLDHRSGDWVRVEDESDDESESDDDAENDEPDEPETEGDESEPDVEPALDPTELTIDELGDALDDVDDVDAIEAARELEADDENRSGATDAFDTRLDELEG